MLDRRGADIILQGLRSKLTRCVDELADILHNLSFENLMKSIRKASSSEINFGNPSEILLKLDTLKDPDLFTRKLMSLHRIKGPEDDTVEERLDDVSRVGKVRFEEELVEERDREELVEERDREELVEERDREELVEERDREELVEERDREELVEERDGEELVEERDGEELVEERDGEELLSKREIGKSLSKREIGKSLSKREIGKRRRCVISSICPYIDSN